jgi:hypothetical protein
MRGCNNLFLRLDLVQTTIRPEWLRPAFESFRQRSALKGVLSNQMEVNFFKLREALETIRNFFKNKINYTQLFDFILF